MANKIEFEATMSTSKFAGGAASIERTARETNDRMANYELRRMEEIRTAKEQSFQSSENTRIEKDAKFRRQAEGPSLRERLEANKKIRDSQVTTANTIFQDQPSEQAKKNAVLRQELILRKAIRDTQSKLPNKIFLDTPEEAALKRKQDLLSGKLSARDIGRHISGLGAGQAQLVHSLRATVDSLASGQNPFTILLQQGPQVAQAFSMMGEGALGFAKKLLMMPIVWAIAGFVALAAALFFVIKHFKELDRVQENLRKLTDLTTTTFDDQVKAMKDARDAHAEQVQWLRKHAIAQDNLAESADKALKALREKSKFEHDLASAKGASRAQLARMDIEAAKAELALLQKQADLAEQAHHKSFLQQKAAAEAKARFASGDGAQLNAQKKKLEEAAALVKEIEEKVAKEKIREIDVAASTAAARAGGTGFISKIRAATDRDKFDTADFGKMSLAEARDKYRAIESSVILIEQKEKSINELLKDKTTLTDDQKKQYEKLRGEITSLQGDIGLKEKFLPQLARFGHGGAPGGDSLSSIGNFLGANRGLVNSVAEQHLGVARQQLTEQQKTTKAVEKVGEKITSGGGGDIEVPGG